MLDNNPKDFNPFSIHLINDEPTNHVNDVFRCLLLITLSFLLLLSFLRLPLQLYMWLCALSMPASMNALPLDNLMSDFDAVYTDIEASVLQVS